MKTRISPVLSLGLLVFLLLLLHSIRITAQEVVNSRVQRMREFDYIEGSAKGPQHWGKLKKEWAACNNGDHQSPIDLSSRRVKVINKLGDLTKNYKLCNATIKNRGHDISVQWVGDAGSIQINGTEYKLQQGHWHSPSEHSIHSSRYDLELHMVHVSSDPSVKDKIAVVGLLYKADQPDEFLSKMMKSIAFMADTIEERKVGVIHPGDIKMDGRKYYQYIGSLTVPPCTEGVIWIINEKMRTVSREQVKQLRLAVHDYAEKNARPVQPLNLREVHLFGPKLERD